MHRGKIGPAFQDDKLYHDAASGLVDSDLALLLVTAVCVLDLCLSERLEAVAVGSLTALNLDFLYTSADKMHRIDNLG